MNFSVTAQYFEKMGETVKGESVNCGLSVLTETRDTTELAKTETCLPCLLIRFNVWKISGAVIVFDSI